MAQVAVLLTDSSHEACVALLDSVAVADDERQAIQLKSLQCLKNQGQQLFRNAFQVNHHEFHVLVEGCLFEICLKLLPWNIKFLLLLLQFIEGVGKDILLLVALELFLDFFVEERNEVDDLLDHYVFGVSIPRVVNH